MIVQRAPELVGHDGRHGSGRAGDDGLVLPQLIGDPAPRAEVDRAIDLDSEQ